MKKPTRKKLFITVGIVVVILIIIVVNLKKSTAGKIKVQTDIVTRGKLVSSVSGSAKIQPEVQVKISAKVSGQIVKLGVKDGDDVKKDQFLVQLDPEYYRAAVEQTESNLRYAMAGFEKAKNEYERSKKLFRDNLLSQAELDLSKSSYEQAKAQVDQYDAALKQARDNLAKTTIYSPMDGTVSQLNKKAGEMAMGSQFTLDVIMVVADLNKMLAETEIDENDVISISVGDTAKITVDAFSDTTFLSMVKEIANTGTIKGKGTQEEVTNFLVKVSMLDIPHGLRPGMSATVDIITETREHVLKVPIQCVTERQPLKPEKTNKKNKLKHDKKRKTNFKNKEKPIKVVFVVEDRIAYQTPLETGISSDTELEIIKGLEEEDEVVSGTYRVLSKKLKHGDRVKVDNTLKKYRGEEK